MNSVRGPAKSCVFVNILMLIVSRAVRDGLRLSLILAVYLRGTAGTVFVVRVLSFFILYSHDPNLGAEWCSGSVAKRMQP